METRTLPATLRALLDTAEPAHLGPQTRPGALPIPEIDRLLEPSFQEANVAPSVQNLLRAILYLWHDHLDESHRIAQEIASPDGSLAHAIMHRREPDYSNSKYWFRRVGVHPAFLSLAVRAGEFLEKSGESDFLSRLVPNKTWDPFAFVDAVEDAASGQFPSKVQVLEQLQKIETEAFIDSLLRVKIA